MTISVARDCGEAEEKSVCRVVRACGRGIERVEGAGEVGGSSGAREGVKGEEDTRVVRRYQEALEAGRDMRFTN